MAIALGAALAVFLAAILAIGVMRWVGDALNPPISTVPERVPYHGGFPPEVHAWNRFHIRWYAMALLFLAFDMEMVFMYPWAVVVAQIGPKAVIEMFGFLAVLVAGVVYAWREGAFRWV